MEKQKFKVNDWVKPIGSDNDSIKAQVISTLVETCPGGTQYHYHIRVYTRVESLRMKQEWFPNKDYSKFNQCELIKYVKPPKEKEKK